MPIVKYKPPIGVHYGEELEFAEDFEDLRVGIWLFAQDGNTRYYPPSPHAAPIYEGHFVPMYIAGETKTHWHISRSKNIAYDPKDRDLLKLKKASLSRTCSDQYSIRCFLTLNEYHDLCWLHHNGRKIRESVGECQDVAKLAKVLECLEDTDIFDYVKYLQSESRRGPGERQKLGMAIKMALDKHMLGHSAKVIETVLYRNIANAIEYQDAPVSENLLLWQKQRKERGW